MPALLSDWLRPGFRWWAYPLIVVGVAVLAGHLWYHFAPRTEGFWVSEGLVSYVGSDDPTATVAAVYLLIAVVGGLLCGLPAVGIGDRHVLGRSMLLILAGIPGGLIAYGIGYFLGPPSAAAQYAAAGASTTAVSIQVPLALPSPLFALAWPAATASMITIGLLLSLFVAPSRHHAAVPSTES